MVKEKPYQGLAHVYDYLLSGVDYEEWANYMEEIMDHFHLQPHTLVDLACGTGSSTIPWAKRGYEVCGVDISPEMLQAAREKAACEGLSIPFYEQDLRNLQLPFKTDMALLFQDGLNYLLSDVELERALTGIQAMVRPGGFFVFNLNEVEKLPAGGDGGVTVVDDEHLTLIWESNYEAQNKIWQVSLTAFARLENGFYRKIQEEHRERSYSREEVERVLSRTGWKLRACFSPYTLREAVAEDRHIFYALQREGAE